jgi:hypothetical protein
MSAHGAKELFEPDSIVAWLIIMNLPTTAVNIYKRDNYCYKSSGTEKQFRYGLQGNKKGWILLCPSNCQTVNPGQTTKDRFHSVNDFTRPTIAAVIILYIT